MNGSDDGWCTLLTEGKRPSPAGGRRVYERLLAPAGPLGGQGRCAGLVQNTKQEVEALPIRSVAHPDMPGPIASLDVRREGRFMEHERSACIVLAHPESHRHCMSLQPGQSIVHGISAPANRSHPDCRLPARSRTSASTGPQMTKIAFRKRHSGRVPSYSPHPSSCHLIVSCPTWTEPHSQGISSRHCNDSFRCLRPGDLWCVGSLQNPLLLQNSTLQLCSHGWELRMKDASAFACLAEKYFADASC